jgi:DNA primase
VPQFGQEFIEKVRTAVDIVEIIGKDVKLTQRGRNFVGLCPFHDEKTPSFTVSRSNQLYYCFGCGSGGDVYNYLVNSRQMTFPEAVAALAEHAGLEPPRISPQQSERGVKAQQMYELNRLAAVYYYRMLRSDIGQEARSYLVQRGIGHELAKQFYLGFAPDAWDGLVSFLEANTELPLELAEEAGLIIKGQRGYYDRFRSRIIFPICDLNKRFVGFGGRIIGSGEPKYLNTPETLIFHKGRNLYGLNWSKGSIKQRNCLVLVEGYTDYISLYAKGVTNVAASLGTAFTEHHARLISRLTKNVVIAFDSDLAGVKATQRGLNILVDAGLNVRVAVVPEGSDPDSFARSRGTGEVMEWVEQADPYLVYQIKTIASQHDINSPEGKVNAAKEIINILRQVDSIIERVEYSKYVAELLSIDQAVINAELNRAANRIGSREKLGRDGRNSHIAPKNRYTIKDLRGGTTGQTDPSSSEQAMAVETSVMQILMADPDLIGEMLAIGLDAESFSNPDYKHLFSLLLSDAWDKQGEAVADLLLSLPEPSGSWTDYVQLLQEAVWFRSLNSMEEKLALVENHRESDVLLQFCHLVKHYSRLRKDIFRARRQ